MEIQMISRFLYDRFLSTFTCVVLLSVVLGMGLTTSHAFAGESDINAVKTAFVFNIIKFVQWEHKNPQIELCDLVTTADLERNIRSLQGKMAAGKLIKISSGASSCNVVFVDGSTISSVSQQPKTLIICDNGGCNDSRVMVNLLMVDKKIRFRINKDALKSAGLEVSSELLKLSI